MSMLYLLFIISFSLSGADARGKGDGAIMSFATNLVNEVYDAGLEPEAFLRVMQSSYVKGVLAGDEALFLKAWRSSGLYVPIDLHKSVVRVGRGQHDTKWAAQAKAGEYVTTKISECVESRDQVKDYAQRRIIGFEVRGDLEIETLAEKKVLEVCGLLIKAAFDANSDKTTWDEKKANKQIAITTVAKLLKEICQKTSWLVRFPTFAPEQVQKVLNAKDLIFLFKSLPGPIFVQGAGIEAENCLVRTLDLKRRLTLGKEDIAMLGALFSVEVLQVFLGRYGEMRFTYQQGFEDVISLSLKHVEENTYEVGAKDGSFVQNIQNIFTQSMRSSYVGPMKAFFSCMVPCLKKALSQEAVGDYAQKLVDMSFLGLICCVQDMLKQPNFTKKTFEDTFDENFCAQLAGAIRGVCLGENSAGYAVSSLNCPHFSFSEYFSLLLDFLSCKKTVLVYCSKDGSCPAMTYVWGKERVGFLIWQKGGEACCALQSLSKDLRRSLEQPTLDSSASHISLNDVVSCLRGKNIGSASRYHFLWVLACAARGWSVKDESFFKKIELCLESYDKSVLMKEIDEKIKGCNGLSSLTVSERAELSGVFFNRVVQHSLLEEVAPLLCKYFEREMQMKELACFVERGCCLVENVADPAEFAQSVFMGAACLSEYKKFMSSKVLSAHSSK